MSDLRQAPELAVLAVLHAGLRATLAALTAEHPTLDDSAARASRRPSDRRVGSLALLSP